jgi:hypothetical protein
MTLLLRGRRGGFARVPAEVAWREGSTDVDNFSRFDLEGEAGVVCRACRIEQDESPSPAGESRADPIT